jgi:hypothetical protein
MIANGSLQVIGATHGQVVAGVAGDETRLGKAGVEKELLAQFHHRGLRDLCWLNGLDRLVGSCPGGGDADRQEGGCNSSYFHNVLLSVKDWLETKYIITII